MFVQSVNLLSLMNINKRVLFAVIVLTMIFLAVALFAFAPNIVLAGPATSPSACGTCAG